MNCINFARIKTFFVQFVLFVAKILIYQDCVMVGDYTGILTRCIMK